MKTKIVIALSSLLATSTACTSEDKDPDPLIGLWRSTESVAGERNELDIGPNLTGTATIYFYFGDELYYADFTAVAFVSQSGRRYEIEMICDGSCSDIDFEMDCVMTDDRNMKCDGNKAFSDYNNLNFRRY